MLTKPLAKFNSTFSVGVSGNKYAIIGKQVGTANPTLTLNAMGINYENSSISSEELVRGPDYKEFIVKENTPIIRATTNSITFETSDDFEVSGDRSIHRVYFSNIGYYVVQSEEYSGNDDFSSVVGYGFQPMNTNLERYGDLVELFRFVTVGAEEEGDFINVYQAIGSGIPPVDSFGVVPEVNYVSREGSNNIQFTDSNNNYFTLVGQNYSNSPKKVYFNFGSELEEEGYNVLFNDTLFDGNLGHISFRDAGGDTDYRFTPNNLSLELSQNRYIKMGITDGLELKNDNSTVSMGNNGLGLQNGESSIVLADNGNIDLSSQNINLNAASVEIEAPSVEIESSDVEIASPNVNIAATDVDIESSSVDIESSSVDIESSYIKIRAKKDFWPEELISSMQYVFDPREYGEYLLKNRCMGAHRGLAPQLDDEAESSEMDINQALYKTEDDNWCLGLWAVEGKDVVSQWDSTYLVVITRSPGEEEYKFDFVRWVEYHATGEKADPFVFSVFPHDTAFLTYAWGSEENDAFYQRDKITIKSESTTDIDSALSVSGKLEVGGNLEVDGDISTPSGLQIGSPNYKLVFLSGEVELKTEYTEISPNKYTVHWKNGTKKYLLNNFPVLGQRAFKAIVSLEQINGNIVDYETFWYGNFPLHVELGVGAYDVRVVEMTSSGVLLGLYESSSGDKLGQDEDRNVQVTIPKFTGWAWEVIS